jgi:tetratricopeptide (TPR) repeat protein
MSIVINGILVCINHKNYCKMKKILILTPALFLMLQFSFAQTAEEYYNRGVFKGNSGDYKGEIYEYNKSIEINPNFAEAYYNRGNTRAKLGHYKGAIGDFNKAIEINPDFAVAYSGRAATKNDLGNYKGAIADCNKAIKLVPDNSDAYLLKLILMRQMFLPKEVLPRLI